MENDVRPARTKRAIVAAEIVVLCPTYVSYGYQGDNLVSSIGWCRRQVNVVNFGAAD